MRMLYTCVSSFPGGTRHALLIACGILLLSGGSTIAASPPVGPRQPWIGRKGINETTRQIMDRNEHQTRLTKAPFRPLRKHAVGRMGEPILLANPASENVPSVGASPGASAPVETAQSSGINFTAATLTDTGAFPPDSMGGVGPLQVIVAVNGRIRSFNKSTGVADGVLNLDTDVFFNSVLTPPATNNFTSDPRIRYDRLSGRWFVVMIDVPQKSGSVPNRIMIAVSSAAVITPSTVWTFFQFEQDVPTPTSHTDNGKFADYPTLGVDANALYVGVNIFATRGLGSFSSTTAFVIRKSSLLTGGPIAVTPFRGLASNSPNDSGPFTPQGVDNYDPNATEGYVIGVSSRLLGQLALLRISDPGGSPTMSQVYVTVPLTGDTINVPHLGNNNGSNGELDGLDRRLIAAHLRNGRLWTCSNIALDNTGSPSGTDTRMGIRWYELNGIASGQTPGVVQAGTLFQPSVSNTTDQRNYWMGSIMVSGQGHAVLGFSAAGQNEHVNVGYAGRLAGDPLGTLRTPVLVTSSTSAYNPPGDSGNTTGRRRWGDYSYTVVDPDDDMTMWTFQEWCQAPNSYAVQVLKVLAPPPATPTAMNPAAVNAGQSNLNVTVTGIVVDGSGFFDPAASLSNHIAATVNGGGISVNSVTYNNPTNLTLNLSVASNATGGTRTLTVINPDGQSITSSSGLLTVHAAVPTNHSPQWIAITNQVVNEETLLTFTAQATDPDGNNVSFSLETGAPAGAAVDPTNGVFTWTPTEADGPSSNMLSLIATDDGSPPLSATQEVSVVVNEVNLPPQLTPIVGSSLHAGMSLVVSNSATDADIPTNTLTYSLDPGAPPAANIDPGTGLLTWPTADSDAGSTNFFTVRVTDNGQPQLDDSQSFSVIVGSRPVIQSILSTNDQVNVTWSSINGIRYHLQYKTNLTNSSWTDLPAEVTATGNQASGQDTAATNRFRLYRVRTSP